MNTTSLRHRYRVAADGQARCGYTLVELVASVAATGILLAGMGSVIMTAARSTNEGALPARQIEASNAAREILTELEYATSFTERTATAVEFTVADRNADAVVETIRYAWSGTPGDPLTRQYNGGTVVDYLDNVHAFAYTDLVETVITFDGTTTHHVFRCDLTLQVGDDSAARMVGSVQAFNAPEVSAP